MEYPGLAIVARVQDIAQAVPGKVEGEGSVR
jgi:hypothetical protein